MKWAQINIQRGLQFKVFEIIEWCNSLDVDLVAICETGLCPEYCGLAHACAEIPEIDGWRWTCKSRNIHGGGVGFLIRDTVVAKPRDDLSASEVEECWIEVYRKG